MYRISSREFNQDVGKAKRAAKQGHVFITDRGKPAHVLLTIDDYHKLVGKTKSVADLLSMPDAEFEFEPTRSKDVTMREIDLS